MHSYNAETLNGASQDVGKFEVRKLKADSKSSRSSVFQEESEVIKFPLLDGSTAVQMAVTHGWLHFNVPSLSFVNAYKINIKGIILKTVIVRHFLS